MLGESQWESFVRSTRGSKPQSSGASLFPLLPAVIPVRKQDKSSRESLLGPVGVSSNVSRPLAATTRLLEYSYCCRENWIRQSYS